MKKILNIFYFLIISFLILIGAMLSLSLLKVPGNYKVYTVQSGSMEPSIHTGSVVLVKPLSDYQKQDVIAFKAPEDIDNPNPKTTTTHRIIDIQDNKFQTKGDANDGPDGGLVDPKLVVGKVIFSLPLLGYPISFARTQTGLIVLIIVPATIIVYSELLNIKNEIVRLISSRKPKKKDEEASA